MYECEGTGTVCSLTPSFRARAEEVNFIEERIADADLSELKFRAFEIRTVRLYAEG